MIRPSGAKGTWAAPNPPGRVSNHGLDALDGGDERRHPRAGCRPQGPDKSDQRARPDCRKRWSQRGPEAVPLCAAALCGVPLRSRGKGHGGLRFPCDRAPQGRAFGLHPARSGSGRPDRQRRARGPGDRQRRPHRLPQELAEPPHTDRGQGLLRLCLPSREAQAAARAFRASEIWWGC